MTNRGFYHIIIIQEVGAYDILAILKESTLVLGVPLPRTLKCGTIQVGMLLPKTLKCRKMRNIIFNEKNDKGM